jgi:hypothetical protein
MISATVDALKRRRLEFMLKSLPMKIQRKIIREETRAAINSSGMLKAARQKAPKATGALRRAITVRAIKRSRRFAGVELTLRDDALAKKGGKRVKVFYGGFQERGWRVGKRSRELNTAMRLISRRANEDPTKFTLRQKMNRLNPLKSQKMLANEQRARLTASMDTRRKIPGKFFLKKVADTVGPIAQRTAINEIARRVEREAKRG